MFASLNELGSLILDVQGRILTARFLNSAGAVRDHFAISKLPLVTVTAPVAVTGAERPPAGQITLSRTRNLDAPLSLRLDIRGSAKPDVDYFKIANPLTIPAGASSITLFCPADRGSILRRRGDRDRDRVGRHQLSSASRHEECKRDDSR